MTVIDSYALGQGTVKQGQVSARYANLQGKGSFDDKLYRKE